MCMSCAVCERYYAVKHLRPNITSAENPAIFITVHISLSFFTVHQCNKSFFLMEKAVSNVYYGSLLYVILPENLLSILQGVSYV